MAAVCLKHDHLLKVFSLNVIHVLTEQSDKSIPVSKFVAVYEKLHNHKLRAQNFGFASLDELLCAIAPVVKVRERSAYFVRMAISASLCSLAETSFHLSWRV